MKLKIFLLSLLLVFFSFDVKAEDGADKNIFNHLSIGVDVGMPGIGFDVAMPICNYVQMRAGVSFFPTIKVNTDLDVYIPAEAYQYGYDIPNNIDVEGKIGFVNGDILFDVYPFKKSNFHVTVGAYFGSSEVAKAYNKEDGVLLDVVNYNNNEGRNNPIGVTLGDYLLTPDENGNVNAQLKTASFKPYVGLGFGRAVPRKRIGFMFDLGVQFWGSPSIWCNDEKLHKDKVGDSSGGAIIKTISKITVYPVINFRLSGRIF